MKAMRRFKSEKLLQIAMPMGGIGAGCVCLSGNGALIGVGNGDPNCQQSDKEPRRSLFNGLAQVIVQASREPGEIRIEAFKEGWDGPELTPAKLTITTRRVQPRPSVVWNRNRD